MYPGTYTDLAHEPAEAGEEGTCTRGGAVIDLLYMREQRHGIPDNDTIHVPSGAGYENAKNGRDSHKNGAGNASTKAGSGRGL